MKILELFKRPKRNTALLAKERLQIIVSHESARKTGPDVIRKMQQEILEVICRYVHIDQDKIKVQLERHGDQSVLELNVTLPDGKLMQLTPPTEPSSKKSEETLDEKPTPNPKAVGTPETESENIEPSDKPTLKQKNKKSSSTTNAKTAKAEET